MSLVTFNDDVATFNDLNFNFYGQTKNSSPGYGLFGFNPDSGTFELMVLHGGVLSGWPSSGSFIFRKGDFSDGFQMTMIKAGQQTQLDVLICSDAHDNPFVMYQDHTFYDMLTGVYSCPKTRALAYYGDRVWALKGNLAAFSDAFPATYYPTPAKLVGDQTTYSATSGDKIKLTLDGTVYDNIDISGASTISGVASAINSAVGSTIATVGAFPDDVGVLVITSTRVGTVSALIIADGTSSSQTCIAKLFSTTSARTAGGYAPFDQNVNAFRVPVGEAKAVLGTREQGLIFMGADQIWQLLPSAIPNPTTDFPQRILDIGCQAGYTACQVADDIYFLASDGVRGLFRTQLDKLQTGQSFPLSYPLADEFDRINWAQIDKACAIYFNNKYIISLPVDGSSNNNMCWVYYPALKAWVVYEGWNIARFATMNSGGQQKLYGVDSDTGQVYELFKGTSDNGNAIVIDEISKAEDFKAPMQYKYGGEYKVRCSGGNGTLIVSANPDGLGWVVIGHIDLALTGVTFPTIFPVHFSVSSEALGNFHLDSAGIIKFKKCQFEHKCTDLNANVAILETMATCFQEPYISEG